MRSLSSNESTTVRLPSLLTVGHTPFDLTAEVMENLAGPNTEKHPYEEARHELFHETNKDEVYTDVFDFIHRTIP